MKLKFINVSSCNKKSLEMKLKFINASSCNKKNDTFSYNIIPNYMFTSIVYYRIVLMLGIVITCFIYIHLFWSMTLEETFPSPVSLNMALLFTILAILN